MAFIQELAKQYGVDPQIFTRRENNTVENKQELLGMATRGEPRPKKGHRLYQSLATYLDVRDGDLNFRNKVEKLAPDWILELRVKRLKEKLLTLAKKSKGGVKSRPCCDSKDEKERGIAEKLSHYINTDDDFRRQITEIAPLWVLTQSERAALKKKEFIAMAKANKPRPIGKDGSYFNNYCAPKNSCYDSKFARYISKIAPQWFPDRLKEFKEDLLKMAKNGEPKPNPEDKKATRLRRFTSPKSKDYDGEFTNKLKESAPKWFMNQQILAMDLRKEELLKMAEQREPKPTYLTKIGKTFYRYTTAKSFFYDKSLTAKLREIAPAWFIKKSEIKKNNLIQLASAGEQRPKSSTSMGSALSRYTYEDADFRQKLHEIAPHWFRK